MIKLYFNGQRLTGEFEAVVVCLKGYITGSDCELPGKLQGKRPFNLQGAGEDMIGNPLQAAPVVRIIE